MFVIFDDFPSCAAHLALSSLINHQIPQIFWRNSKVEKQITAKLQPPKYSASKQ